jgi:hypothetical protein
MYLINEKVNRIIPIEKKAFKDTTFEERKNLQEWLANEPSAFGEELLIIQKEFDGFDDTNERLDLLAIDKDGNLVIIENKLDNSGTDVTWQALKYSSYCSTLQKDQIKDIYQKYLERIGSTENAEEKIMDFLSVKSFEDADLNNEQRIIFVAGKYRKEVTSTVLWLRDKYKLNIKCLEVILSKLGNQFLLDIEQIIPPKKEVEEYMIKISDKNQEEITVKARTAKNIEFWTAFINESNKVNKLFEGISPSKDQWISVSRLGLTDIKLVVAVSRTYVRSEVYFSKGDKIENKRAFDFIVNLKQEIETELNEPLIWERIDDKAACRIKLQLDGVSIDIKEDWPKMINFIVEKTEKMAKVFKPLVDVKLRAYLAKKTN